MCTSQPRNKWAITNYAREDDDDDDEKMRDTLSRGRHKPPMVMICIFRS